MVCAWGWFCVYVCVLRTPALRKVCDAPATSEEGKSEIVARSHAGL